MKTLYVCGFCFDYQRENVVLIRKNRPDWQKGKLNGVGGHVNVNEKPIDAMSREFMEEAGVDVWAWNEFCVYEGDDYIVHFFKAFSQSIDKVRTITDEIVGIYELTPFLFNDTLPNLKWLIPLALDIRIGSVSVNENLNENK